MNILFVSDNTKNEEHIKDFFLEIGFEIDYLSFRDYNKNLNTISFISYDFIFIELLGNEKRKYKYIKNCQKQRIAYIVNVIFIFDYIDLNKLTKNTKLEKFDYLLKPCESKDVLEKIESYSNIDKNLFDNYKMIVKGKLLRPLEHQWKQPLNVIATNLLNLELKSELSKLKSSDVSEANEKVEEALGVISNTISNLNRCFATSNAHTYFSIDYVYKILIEFISPQMQKYEITLNKNTEDMSIKVENYENEFTLNLLVCLYVFIQYFIENSESSLKKNINLFYEKNENIDLYISFEDKLPLYDMLNIYNFEFLIIKKLLKKLNAKYCIDTYNDDKTQIKISF